MKLDLESSQLRAEQFRAKLSTRPSESPHFSELNFPSFPQYENLPTPPLIIRIMRSSVTACLKSVILSPNADFLDTKILAATKFLAPNTHPMCDE